MEVARIMRDATRKVLARIHGEQRTYGEEIPPAATDSDVATLVAVVREMTGVAPPPGYLAFLRIANGLDVNGTTIYATRERRRANGTWQLGLPEANLAFDDGASRLLLGETGDEYFAVDLGTDRGVILDKVSLTVLEEFDGAEGLLYHVLRSAAGPG
jgi:hypothetical protein